VNDYGRNEDAIIACATVLFVIAVLIGTSVLASGHGIYMPPTAPAIPVTTTGETTAP
jgi:hypothetical protein